MSQRGNYVDRVVVSSPVHRHTLIGVLFTKYAFDGLAVDISAGHEKLFPIREQETFEGLRRTSRLITEQQEKGN